MVLAIAIMGCTDSESTIQPLSWDEFQSQAYQEPDTGIYVVNGDEIAASVDELRVYYQAYRASVDSANGIGTSQDELIVNVVNGADDRWSATQAQNLTYCVSSKTFGSHYADVVNAMAAATAAWEAVARVKYVHATSLDGNCTARTANVVFDVRQVSHQQYLARAFFPSTWRRGREVLIDSSSFGTITPYTLAGILRHELGHTLGFRHEHTRPESGTCFEDNSWRALTAYDSASVMHYPQCNGTNQGDLDLTNLDRTGAGVLYP